MLTRLNNLVLTASIDPVVNHIMNVLKLPKSITKKIDKFRRDFLWHDREGNHKMHVIGWVRICCSMTMGGLGIRDLDANNEAFLAKPAWRNEPCFDPIITG